MTKEGWPTRSRKYRVKGRIKVRYYVFVNGQWLSRQRAAQIRRELAGRAAREKGASK